MWHYTSKFFNKIDSRVTSSLLVSFTVKLCSIISFDNSSYCTGLTSTVTVLIVTSNHAYNYDVKLHVFDDVISYSALYDLWHTGVLFPDTLS